MKNNILITGFEPFNNDIINSSWEVIKRLPDSINGYKINKLLLPVKFEESSKIVIEKANKLKVKYIICVGQAKGRKYITPEMKAINLKSDNYTSKKECNYILSTGPKYYYSSIDVNKIYNSINNAGIKCNISNDAGTYVCNDLFFNLLHYYNNTNIKVSFIHIPILEEQAFNNEPSIDINTGKKAIIEVINNL